MDFEKKYNDLVERLNKAKNDEDVCDDRFCVVIDEILLESKESEDERMRKCLISYLKGEEDECEYRISEMIAYLEKQKHMEWSEEDEEMIDRICANLEYLIKEAGCDSKFKEVLGKRIKWMQRLKSLRPPFKDREMKLKILKYLSTRCSSLEFEEVEDYLNDLRPSWKPSEEQMEWLESAVRLSTNKPRIHGIIISLYEQLKRLI